MKNNTISLVLVSSFLFSGFTASAQDFVTENDTIVEYQVKESQWKGKRVAFLGDSITDKKRIGTKKCYWEYLAESLGIEPIVYAINGNQWNGVLIQAATMKDDIRNDVDAIIVFAGTNDYNAGIPIGEWYTETEKDVEVSGPKTEKRKHRDFNYNSDTFTGRINNTMKFLKANYPTQQIILMTPIHRGYAKFNDKNIQPQETYANKQGLFINDYVDIIKQAGNVWAVPVIDMNSVSGLYPAEESHSIYVAKEKTDRLHPNAEGHRRMAKALEYQLMAFPASFND